MPSRPSSPVLPEGASAAPALHLRLLGAVEVRGPRGALVRWPSRAAAALLARLAMAPQRAHPREELVELLWPGVALEVGRNRLRQTLSTLKRLLDAEGPWASVVQADRHALRVAPDALRCDAADFERQARGGQLAHALSLYRGEFMPGFHDDWVIETRGYLAALHERAEARAAALASPASTLPSTALPATWTRVYGIEHSATRLLTLVRSRRLVTVTGPGGCGKTRLVLESARALREAPAWSMRADAGDASAPRFAHIVFVSLVDCRTEAHVLAALAGALQLGSGDTLRQATEKLAAQPVLLVLDNFEQLAATAASLPLALLEALPQLHLLVTSRVRVGWPGEQVFELGGLALPAADATSDLGELATNPAVALYLDRARSVAGDFASQADELPAVAELVRRLDGMPLALELAASRVVGFPPPRMLQLMDAGGTEGIHLALLARTAPRSGRDARHASIAEVIDWSWRLLSADAQAVMRALAAGAGDMASTTVAAMLGQSDGTTALLLDELAAHSMLRLVPGPTAMRCLVLEPVREFVRSRCSADELQRLQRLLQQWLLHWALALPRSAARALVEAELHLVLAALAAGGPESQPVLRLALALRAHWESSGMPLALQQALEASLARHDADIPGAEGTDALSAEAHELLAYLRFESGFAAPALQHAEAALARAGADPAQRARALTRRVWLELAAGRSSDTVGARTAQLQTSLDEALSLAQSVGDRDAEARTLHQLAVLASHMKDDWSGAEQLLARSQALWLALGDRRKAFARLRNRAQCWLRLGRTDEALDCFEHCARAAQDDDDPVGRIDSLISLSSLLGTRKQWAAALRVDRDCVRLCWAHWHRHGLAYALWNPPLALVRLRRPSQAVRLMAFAANFWVSTFGPLALADRQTLRRVRRLAAAQLGPVAVEALWTEGATLPIAAAVALALQDDATA